MVRVVELSCFETNTKKTTVLKKSYVVDNLEKSILWHVAP